MGHVDLKVVLGILGKCFAHASNFVRVGARLCFIKGRLVIVESSHLT
jgi:hypothetical protein